MRLQIIDKNEGFSCGGCTLCCQQPYTIVIEKEKAEALGKADFSKYEQLQGQEFYYESNDAPDGFHMLTKQQGTTKCSFLDNSDGLCIIHKEMGADAKPGPCLKFPFHESPTFVDHRISVDFGCPSVIDDKAPRLLDQEEKIAAIAKIPQSPPDYEAFIGLDGETGVQHDEFDALAIALEKLFAPGRDTSIWTAFGAGLTLVEQTIAKKKAAADDICEWLASNQLLDEVEAAVNIVPLARIKQASSPVRIRFAATLMRDALPKEVTVNMSLWRRIASLPKLMPLVKLTGTYFSKVQQREIDIDQVLDHPLPGGIAAEGTVLLKRCFRARIWQRYLIGTRLSVTAGLHQHIQDLNSILFLARADACYNQESELTYDVVAKNLSRFEFNFANQVRLFRNNSLAWFNNQLNDIALARDSINMMAMGGESQPMGPPQSGSQTASAPPVVLDIDGGTAASNATIS
jgi:Fe-S-cluster containining protein